MTYVLSIMALASNLLIVLAKRHCRLFSVFLIAILWLLVWGATDNADYRNYEIKYEMISESDYVIEFNVFSEFGFASLMRIASLMSLNYSGFLFIVSFLALLLIDSTVVRYCKNTNYVYLLYFLFPFFLNAVQIRNFLAMSLLVFSIRYIVDDYRLKKIRFLVLILFASLIHISFVAYIPLVLVTMKKRKTLIGLIVVISVSLSSVLVISGNSLTQLGFFLTDATGQEKIALWLNTRTRFGFLISWLTQITIFALAVFSRNAWLQRELRTGHSSFSRKTVMHKEKRFAEVVFWIDLYAFSFFPLYVSASTFDRLLQNLLVLNYVAFASTSLLLRENPKKQALFNLFVFGFVFVLFYFRLFVPFENTVFLPIMNSNSVLGGF